MRKVYLLLLVFLCCYNTWAQQVNTNAARFIKITAADSNAAVKETVKAQLYKNVIAKKQKSVKVFVTAADKNTALGIARRVAAKQQQNILQADIATLISKYTAETEKNLDQLLTKAAEKNCILLFDEADALFAQEDNTPEAKDRSDAAVFLLDRLVNYKGTVIVCCTGFNCRNNVELPLFVKIKAD